MSKNDTAWHNLDLSAVFNLTNSSQKGLDSLEAKKRLDKVGFNVLAKADKFSVFDLFISQFKSALVYVLIIAGIISVVFGEFVDASVIFAAVLINVIVGFIQEFKANKSLEKLNKIVKKEVLVFRDGIEKKVEANLLVPGDLIVLESGNRVAADARLIEVNNFEVNEATLTGESWPVKKHLDDLEIGAVLAERANMVFMGTLVVEGRARAVVVNTGFNTEMGKITVMLKETEEEKTPLQQKLDAFAKGITKIIVVVAIGLFIIGILKNHPWTEMFTLAVAVSVSAIPEGLVISMTMILTVGMQRILKNKGLVRRLVSAETLGSTTVICTDKTGTLTEGEMRVTGVVTSKFQLDLSTSSLRDLDSNKEIELIIHIAFFCNDSIIQNPEASGEDWSVLGSPTEKALMIFGANDANIINIRDKMPRIAEIPFDHQRKFMVTRHSYNSKQDIIFIKGAPERVLSYANKYLDNTKTLKMSKERYNYFNSQWQALSKQGLRVLAGAYRLVPKNFSDFDKLRDEPKDFVFAGIWGLSDPLRKEAKNTLVSTLKAGINTVIITGDNKFTARSIARDLGLSFKDDNIVTGEELLKMTDDELDKRVRDIKVYARVSPADKLRIIKAWQSKGEVVSMTGDGVNDAPALKAADIGVAVSSGSDVAKETADLVLLDNNFETIVMAIKEGRVIFANLKRVILYLVSDSFSGVVLIVGSLIFQIPLPISAVQILWINLFSDSFPALALTMEPEDDEIMNKKPARIKSVLDVESRFLIFMISFITGGSALWLFWHYLSSTGDIVLARTVVFAALGLDTLLYVFSIRNLEKNIFKSKPFRNKYLNISLLLGFVIQLSGIYIPTFNRILQTEPLAMEQWFEIFLYIASVITTIEVVKFLFIRYSRRKN